MQISKNLIFITVSIIILILFSFADILLGSTSIKISEIIDILFYNNNSQSGNYIILHEIRIPKTLTAIFAGAGLAVAGLQMQTIFRNPLAGPHILGISSGASLGVAILLLSFSSYFSANEIFIGGTWAIVGAAWIGSFLVLLLIFSISTRVKDVMTILIIGVLIGSIVSAFVNILQYFGNAESLKVFVVWSMGSLGGVTNNQLYTLIPSVLIGIIGTFLVSKTLDILLLGENYSKTMGVNISLARLIIFSTTGILAGSITAFCGPIGFIGIVVPHLAAMVFRTAKHSILVPASAIFGAILLLIADILSTLPTQGAIPINSITAFLGIPIVIFIIFKRKI